MLETQFIGRDDKMQELRNFVIEGIKHRGCTIFIEGTTGMGKRRLLEEFKERAQNDPDLHGAEFILVQCDQNTGSEDAYHPFIDIIESFEKPENRGKEIAKKAITIIQETAPDWLNIIPIFGPAITAGVKTTAKVVDAALTNQNDIPADKAKNLPRQYEKAILEIASSCSVLVLMIADAQWIDKSSCNLLERLARSVKKHNLVIFVTCNSENMDPQHPLRKSRYHMLIDNNTERITLEGLTADEINMYLRSRFGGILDSHLAEWLRDLCNGEPWFVIQYLDFLQQRNIITEYANGKYKLSGQIRPIAGEWEVDGQLKDALRSAENIEELLEMRLSTLTKEELEVLRVSAVQGKRFLDIVLAKLLSKQRNEIKSHLDEIEKKHRLIRYLHNDQDWEKLRSDAYSFVQTLIQQRFYNDLTHTYRSDYHCEVAKTLEEILNDTFKEEHPYGNHQPISRQKLIIQIARHFDLGKKPLAATKYYHQAAQFSFYNGALKEASELCNRALEKIRSLPKGDINNDRLCAEIIQLKLLASEIWWRGKSGSEESRPEEEILIEEAEAAALRTGNKALIANIKHLKGKIFVATFNLDAAVDALEDALQMARDARDPLTESFIMSDLGHQLVGRRSKNYTTKGFEYGLTLQHQAHQLLEGYMKINGKPDIMTDLAKHFYLFKARIGIGEFDQGNYGIAIKWLEDSKKGLEQIKRRKDLAWPLNFLGQLYTAIGLFEDAEKILQEAIELHRDEDEPSAVRANNKALLGKLYLEQGRIIDAEKPILDAWNETEMTWMVAVVPVVRNYYAELLMHSEFPGQDLSLAEQHIKTTIQEVETTKFHRSAIVAYSLWGKLALMQGDIQAALQHSTNAIINVEKMGTMPLIRMEEIFFNHYSILKAAEVADAKNYLDCAHDILKRKANSLETEEHRRKFLERVPVSRNIINEVNNINYSHSD